MNEGAIDTLSIAQRLQKAGFGGEQAEAVTFAIRDGLTGSLADKEDIAHLDGKITALRGEIKEDIADLRGEMVEIRGELKQDIAHLDGKITAEITNLRGEIKEDIAILAGKISVLYWMFSILVAGVASLVIKAFVA